MGEKLEDTVLKLLRSPSFLSTTDGGCTPFTDLSSPHVRSPHVSLMSDVDPEVKGPMVASTNMVRLCLAPGIRADEYVVAGGVDLVAFAFDGILEALAGRKLLLVPNKERTTILCLTTNPFIPAISVDGCWIQYIKSHVSGCCCSICMRALSQVLERRTKIGKYENLSESGLPVAVCTPVVALPAHKLKLTGETGFLSISCDMLVKWVPWGRQSVAEILRLATLQGRSRAEVNASLAHSWIYTVYNGKAYKIKKIWFDMTPLSTFFNKENGEILTFASFMEKRYGLSAVCLSSPMIEAVPEKRSETCYLLPEYCCVLRPTSGFVPMHTVHAQTRTTDRKVCVEAIKNQNMVVKTDFLEAIDLVPLEAEGSIMVSPVSLSLVSDVDAHRWVLIVIGTCDISPYILPGSSPAAILSCASVQNVAGLVRRACSQWTPDLLVVVLKGRSASTYATIKYVSLVECGTPCQVLQADTLMRPNLRSAVEDQIRLKVFGSRATNSGIVALDFHRFGDVSIFTIAWNQTGQSVQVKYILEQSHAPLSDLDMAERYLMLLRKNEKQLPAEPVIVVACRRGITGQENLNLKLFEVFSRFSLVVACVKTDMRLFSMEGSGNMPAGFCVDLPGERGFYLVPHTVDQGNALPVLFLVAETHVSFEVLKNIVWRGYGSEQKRRLPELFRHTLKLSELVGIHLRKCAGRDLKKILEKSQGWKKLLESQQYFYL